MLGNQSKILTTVVICIENFCHTHCMVFCVYFMVVERGQLPRRLCTLPSMQPPSIIEWPLM